MKNKEIPHEGVFVLKRTSTNLVNQLYRLITGQGNTYLANHGQVIGKVNGKVKRVPMKKLFRSDTGDFTVQEIKATDKEKNKLWLTALERQGKRSIKGIIQ